MKNIKRLKWGSFITAMLLSAGAFPLSAQMFEDTAPARVQQQTAPSTDNGRNFNNSWANPRKKPAAAVPSAGSQTAVPSNRQADDNDKPKLSVDKTGAQRALDARQNAARELDKSLKGKRGTSAINQVVMPGEKAPEDDRLIFLFYKDFNVSKTMSGMVMCDVKFIILTTLDNPINNISFRLKWPSIETSLSFNEVAPNVETYFNYTLVGDGCYSMDKIPNVIVNRCRVKGLSQRECANKIRWLKK